MHGEGVLVQVPVVMSDSAACESRHRLIVAERLVLPAWVKVDKTSPGVLLSQQVPHILTTGWLAPAGKVLCTSLTLSSSPHLTEQISL